MLLRLQVQSMLIPDLDLQKFEVDTSAAVLRSADDKVHSRSPTGTKYAVDIIILLLCFAYIFPIYTAFP